MIPFPSRSILKTKDGSQLIEVTYTVNEIWDPIVAIQTNLSLPISQSEHISAIMGKNSIRATSTQVVKSSEKFFALNCRSKHLLHSNAATAVPFQSLSTSKMSTATPSANSGAVTIQANAERLYGWQPNNSGTCNCHPNIFTCHVNYTGESFWG